MLFNLNSQIGICKMERERRVFKAEGRMCKKAHADEKSDEKETIAISDNKLGGQLKERKPV